MAGSWVPAELCPCQERPPASPGSAEGFSGFGLWSCLGHGDSPARSSERGPGALSAAPAHATEPSVTTTRTRHGFFTKKRFNEALNNCKATLCEVITFEDGCSEAGGNPASFIQFLFHGQQCRAG